MNTALETENKSEIQRYLDRRHDVRLLWIARTPSSMNRIVTKCYACGIKTFIVTETDHGWDVYIPASQSNSIATTLDALSAFLDC